MFWVETYISPERGLSKAWPQPIFGEGLYRTLSFLSKMRNLQGLWPPGLPKWSLPLKRDMWKHPSCALCLRLIPISKDADRESTLRSRNTLNHCSWEGGGGMSRPTVSVSATHVCPSGSVFLLRVRRSSNWHRLYLRCLCTIHAAASSNASSIRGALPWGRVCQSLHEGGYALTESACQHLGINE